MVELQKEGSAHAACAVGLFVLKLIYLSAVVSTLTVLSLDWTGQETGDKIVGLLFWSGSDPGEIVHAMSDRFRIVKVKYFC